MRSVINKKKSAPPGGARRRWIGIIMAAIIAMPAFAQDPDARDLPTADEFTFVRIFYATRGGGWGWGTWATDWPEAEQNFLRGVKRLTNIHTNSDPTVLRLSDDAIFNHPFLYMLEMGRDGGAVFSEKEIENFREYVARGGFVMIDDFWGTWQWDTFYYAFSQVFPDRPLVDLDDDHQIFHCFYDIDGPQLVPGRGGTRGRYGGYEADGSETYARAILDDDGRVMVLINWNTDIGDGWEHTYDQWYPTRHSNQAYRLGVNFLMYALTH